MNSEPYNVDQQITKKIKEYAKELGFSACGIAVTKEVDAQTKECYNQWISEERFATMSYLNRNVDKRFDPRLLVPNARSVIVVALGYYPFEKQEKNLPQRSYFSY